MSFQTFTFYCQGSRPYSIQEFGIDLKFRSREALARLHCAAPVPIGN
jgi:hypothetical protein